MPFRTGPLALLLALVVATSAPAQDEVATAMRTVLKRHASVVVAIDVKVAVEIQGRRQEMDNQILGTLVDASGLVLAAKGAIAPEPPDPRMRDQI